MKIFKVVLLYCILGTEADFYAWQEDFWDEALPLLHGESRAVAMAQHKGDGDCDCQQGETASVETCNNASKSQVCCKDKTDDSKEDEVRCQINRHRVIFISLNISHRRVMIYICVCMFDLQIIYETSSDEDEDYDPEVEELAAEGTSVSSSNGVVDLEDLGKVVGHINKAKVSPLLLSTTCLLHSFVYRYHSSDFKFPCI